MPIITTNPATEEIIAHYPFMTTTELDVRLSQAQQAFSAWSKKSIASRAEYLLALEAGLLARKEEYAACITTEMGKPLIAAIQEVEKSALVCRHYAEQAESYLQPRQIKTEMSKSYVSYPPLGVVFAIMPWNFPFWQVFRFAAPALMAGNGVLLKHAPITTGCALEIERLFQQTQFPQHLFQTLLADNEQSATIIRDPRVAAITLTGSLQTGQTVAALAGASIKKIVLELGGNDPYLILEDADLDLAAEAVVASRMNNAGQSCIAAKRILAVDAIKAPFESLILEKLKGYRFGNPKDPQVNLGPLARKDLRDTLDKQVQQSLSMGASLLLGGKIPDQTGYFYPPTVLTGVSKGMPAYEEELFGPVISFISAKNTEEAIRIANETPYGLSCGIFTRDLERGEAIAANEIQAGTVFINQFVRSDPRLPFGGIKCSGNGRELSREGIQEFVNVKTIGIK